MQKKLSLYFPDPYTPSTQQTNILNKIGAALEKNKFVICCAPTGSGKSLLAKTIGNTSQQPTKEFAELITSYLAYKQDFTGNYNYAQECNEEPSSGAFTLTITKSLQDQYTSLFPDTSLLKGKSNYVCSVDENYTVDLAPCTFVPRLKDKCCSNNVCPYYNARNKAILSQFSVLNYKMFLALPDHVKKKNVIICDEASELEEELIRQFSAEIVYKTLEQYGIPFKKLITDNKEKARIWIYSLIENISVKIEFLNNAFSQHPNIISKTDRIQYQYLKTLHRTLSTLDSTWKDCEYVLEVDANRALFTPLRANTLSKYIFNSADKIILLSATIIDHKHFAKSLGINEYIYIEAESEFDPSKSPIYISSAHKLNYKNLKVVLPKICDQIQEIVNHHKTEKGIIHTHTQEITNYLQARLGGDGRFLFRDTFANNEQILKEHKSSKKPTILVSPSLAFGVDLKDDLARFQIIVKLPFFPLGSKRVKKLAQTDPDWYENKMLNSVVQAAGRATRSKKDHAVTYILDATFLNIVKKVKNKLPNHFIERIH